MRALWMVVGAALVGCAGTPERGRVDGYRLDSATAACQRNPALCARMAGEEALLPGTRAVRAMASVGTAGSAVLRVLTDEQHDLIQEALEECANEARSAVLVERFDGKTPTPEQCRAEVAKDAQGRPVTLAMMLGTEMHQAARGCAQARLTGMRPGGFTLEPRYRYNKDTKKWEFLSEADAQALLKQGRGSELKGTLVPDVVIHPGNPLQILALFDFKFPCVIPTSQPRWPEYPPGHTFAGQTQGEVYKGVLRPKQGPTQITPRLGATP
ncbi:hypothetical protein ACLESD_15195 [Pyxidicoccus sp. 3LFB2]